MNLIVQNIQFSTYALKLLSCSGKDDGQKRDGAETSGERERESERKEERVDVDEWADLSVECTGTAGEESMDIDSDDAETEPEPNDGRQTESAQVTVGGRASSAELSMQE